MTKEEIIEGNILIAHWMEYKSDHPEWSQDIRFKVPIFLGDKGEWSKELHSCPADRLYFHKSWDHLMPVMEKIGLDFNARITWTADGIEATFIERDDVFEKAIADFGGFGSIVNTWKAVVKFIKWHNRKFKS